MYTLCIPKEAFLEFSKDENPHHLYNKVASISKLVDTSVMTGEHIPVNFINMIRTDYSNEVVLRDDNLFYEMYPKFMVRDTSATMDDLVILLSKGHFDGRVRISENCISEVINRTDLLPLGAFIYHKAVYVITVVVLDHTLKNEEYFHLNSRFKFVPISELSARTELEELIKNNLVIVGGKENV